jgi:hypothetical protein
LLKKEGKLKNEQVFYLKGKVSYGRYTHQNHYIYLTFEHIASLHMPISWPLGVAGKWNDSKRNVSGIMDTTSNLDL